MGNKCPKCGGEMETGMTVDKSHLFIPEKQQWAKNVGNWGQTPDARTILTYRCRTCGFLESYAK